MVWFQHLKFWHPGYFASTWPLDLNPRVGKSNRPTLILRVSITILQVVRSGQAMKAWLTWRNPMNENSQPVSHPTMETRTPKVRLEYASDKWSMNIKVIRCTLLLPVFHEINWWDLIKGYSLLVPDPLLDKTKVSQDNVKFIVLFLTQNS